MFERYSSLGKKEIEGERKRMLVEVNRNPNQYAIQEQLEPETEWRNRKTEKGKEGESGSNNEAKG